MDLGISGKTALVSASSAGLGFASAQALAEAGCKTVISGRNEERLMHAANKIPNSIPVIADVSTVKGPQALVQDAKSQLGTNIDILITNAGGSRKKHCYRKTHKRYFQNHASSSRIE